MKSSASERVTGASDSHEIENPISTAAAASSSSSNTAPIRTAKRKTCPSLDAEDSDDVEAGDYPIANSTSSPSVALTSGPTHVLYQVLKKIRTSDDAAISTQSILLRFLSQDFNSASVILQFLLWKDLAALYGCCRQWQLFLSNPPSTIITQLANTVSHQGLLLFSVDYQRLQRASWIRSQVKFLQVRNRRSYISSPIDLSGLPLFARLIFFHVELPYKSLNQDVIDSISQLVSLQSLIITSKLSSKTQPHDVLIQATRKLNFTPLQRLAGLGMFYFTPHSRNYYFSKEQFQQVIQISSLCDIDVGVLDHRAEYDPGRSRSQWIADTIAQLHKMPNLQRLESMDFISADIWPHLSRCSQLIELMPLGWADDINWDLLPNLKSTLTKLLYVPDVTEIGNPIPPSLLSALSQCTLLVELHVCFASFQSHELGLVISSLPSLTKLDLVRCNVDDLNCLANSSMEELFLREVVNRQTNRYFQWLAELPVMPKLRKLEIWETIFKDTIGWSDHVDTDTMVDMFLSNYKMALLLKFPSINHLQIRWD